MIIKSPIVLCFLLMSIICFFTKRASGQNYLNRTISVDAKQIKLAELLSNISKKGNFYFSYSSDMIRTDSLVSVSGVNITVRELLDKLFGDDIAYKEAPGYIILRPAPNRLTLLPDTRDEPDNEIEISGYVIDAVTGKKIADASVYEKRLLAATLTDQNGFFKLKLKSSISITLTVSKELYRDTSVNFLSNVTITNKPRNYNYDADTGSVSTEKSWLGRRFISSRMKIQSLNISEFISGVPVQTSILPGIGSHGLMSGQIVNHFSFNFLGGYNAGVQGLELGGFYNLNKEDVEYVQVAGLFNVVGGNFKGIGMAGIHNVVYRNLEGVQAAGIFNEVKQNVHGVQLAGIANITRKTAKGLQAAGFINRAQVMNGIHMALFNIADTLNGCAINLMSFSRNGYHQLGVYTDENAITTLAYKTGNATLYTKIIAGVNLVDKDQYYTYGIGFGHDFSLKKGLLLSTELNAQFIRSSKWNNTHLLDRVSILLNIPLYSKLSIFFGPTFNLYDLGQNNTINEQNALTRNKIGLTGIGQDFKSWVGYSVGFNLF